MVNLKQLFAQIGLASAFCVCLFSAISAQQTTTYITEIDSYREALQLFQQKQFGAAQRLFVRAIGEVDDPNSEIAVNSEYYSALCAVELFHKDAEHLVKEFIADHPESQWVRHAHFQLGRYNYRKRKWQKVITYMAAVNVYDLTEKERSEFYFDLGYSHFMQEDYEKASNMFYEIKDAETPYFAPAQFYYGHINYDLGNYETALQSFRQVENHEKFGRLVPYYIAQIFYQQKNYDKLLDYAPKLLDNAVPSRASEIARLIADAYYSTERYQESIPFFQLYLQKAQRPTREDQYQLAYAYYLTKDYENAGAYFTKLTYTNDSLCQNAMYHLGNCYLKQDKKKFARTAFKSAFELDFDPTITEDALYTYAMLSYELSLDPYQKSITAFQDYIERYPDSDRADEAQGFLLNVFLTTNNFSGAIASLESMRQLTPKLKEAYQQVCFNRAVEMFNSGSHALSVRYFKKAQEYPIDPKINTMTFYWIGDAYYRAGKYSEAASSYQEFLLQPRAIFQPEFTKANYNMAYAHLMLKDQNKAEAWFRKYLADKGSKDPSRVTDAKLRLADGYYLDKDYEKAVAYYREAIAEDPQNSDYGLHQLAMTYGYQGKFEDKISVLNQLLAEHPKSSRSLLAKYELGRSYMTTNETDKAMATFDAIIASKPEGKSRVVKDALVSKGVIYYNRNDVDQALPIFKTVVKDYPTYEDSREAIVYTRNIYTQLDQVEVFEEWIDGLAFVDYSTQTRDSINYTAAANKFFEGDYPSAMASLGKYLERFPNGVFKHSAHYYRAEIQFDRENYQEALADYQEVNKMPFNQFSETSSQKAADINFYYRNYVAALPNFQRLEELAESKESMDAALIGQMNCHFELDNHEQAQTYASLVLDTDAEGEEDLEANTRFILGKSAFELEDYATAKTQFTMVGTLAQDEKAADARYHLARILFINEEYQACEDEIYKLVQEKPEYGYWVAKSLILLADKFVKDEDYFQAKATLKSIIDNYDGDDLVTIANEKLAEAERLEAEAEKPAPAPESDDLDFGYDNLFEEEEVPEEEILESNNIDD